MFRRGAEGGRSFLQTLLLNWSAIVDGEEPPHPAHQLPCDDGRREGDHLRPQLGGEDVRIPHLAGGGREDEGEGHADPV